MASEIDILIKATDQASGTLDKVKRGLDDIDGASGKATGGMSGFSSVLAGIGAGVGMAAINLITQAGQALVQFGVDSVSAASDLDESINKINVVYGANAARIVEWSTTSATALGQSQQQVLEAAGTFGNLFDAMGITEDASMELSKGIVILGSDLASFNNLTPDEVLEKLRAGIVGEYEPLRMLGINLSAATVEMKAMEMTGKSAADQLTESDKVLARHALIVEQTSNAHGDFARTSDGLANSQRIFDAQMEDLSATLGAAFLPLINRMTIALTEFMPKVIAAAEGLAFFVERITTLFPKAGDAVDSTGAKINRWFTEKFPAASAVANQAHEKFSASFAKLSEAIGRTMEKLGEVINRILTKIQEWWTKHGETVMKLVDNTFGTILTIVTTQLNLIMDAITLVLQLITGDWEGAGETLERMTQTMWDAIKSIFTKSLDSIKILFTAGWNALSTEAETKTTAISTVFSAGMGYWVTLAKDKSSEMASGFVTGLSQLATQVATKLVEVHTAALNAFVDAHLWLFDIGKSVVQGFIDGIGNMIGSAQAKVAELANLAAQAAANALGIQSPSKKFMRLGDQSGEGFLIGLERKFARVQGMVNQATAGMNGGGATGTTIDNSRQNSMNVYVTTTGDAVRDVRNQVELYALTFAGA